MKEYANCAFCDREAYCRGMCEAHYRAHYRACKKAGRDLPITVVDREVARRTVDEGGNRICSCGTKIHKDSPHVRCSYCRSGLRKPFRKLYLRGYMRLYNKIRRVDAERIDERRGHGEAEARVGDAA